MARIAISMASSGTDWTTQVQRFGAAAPTVVTAALEGVRAGVLTELRQEIGRAFARSRRMPNLITAKVYPLRDDGVPPTLWIHPRAGSAGRILAAHRGVQIVPTRSGGALAIPTDKVPLRHRMGARLSPDEVARHFGERLALMPARPGSKAWGYLVLRRSGSRRRPAQLVVMFVLVAAVTLPARLRPEVIVAEWARRVPDFIHQAAATLLPRAAAGLSIAPMPAAPEDEEPSA